MADSRFHCDPGQLVRSRGGKKADGTVGKENQQLGRVCCGFETKIQIAVNGLGLPVNLILTPGQAADLKLAKPLLTGLLIEVVFGDKGYDSKDLVAEVKDQGGRQ